MAFCRRQILTLGAVALALTFWAWNFFGSQRELQETRKQWLLLKARKEVLQERAWQLKKEVLSLRSDKESKARAARELLSVASPEEFVVLLPKP
jgi:cell division protein FtsB